MSGRTLIKGGAVLTLGAKSTNLSEGDVLVDGEVIAEVGVGLRSRDAEVIDARDAIVMPGFVDTHRHAWKTLFRNLGGVEQPDTAELGRHHTPDDVYAATLLGLLSAAAAGITTVVDHLDIAVDTATLEAALQAHRDAGLRVVAVPVVPAWSDADDGPAVAAAIGDLVGRGTPGRGSFAAGRPAGTVTDADAFVRDRDAARAMGLRLHAHAGTVAAERGAVARLASRGALADDVTLVHCTLLGDDDLDAIAANGVAVSLTPSTEMAGGLGLPPLQRLLDRGIKPGLGVDDELAAPGDLFAQMRAIQSLQHAMYFDRKLAGKAGLPNLLTTREVIRSATIDGAGAVGLAALTGSLEPGKQADVLVLRTDRPNVHPVNDPIGAVVWGLDTSNVEWVFVAGEARVRAGELQADVAGARSLALAARQRVAHAAGDLADLGSGGAG